MAQAFSLLPRHSCRRLITTHHHSDHSGGNAKFATSAEVISTVNARANIVGHKQPNVPDMYPVRVAFTDRCSVFLGGKEVRAYYFGRGHTNAARGDLLPSRPRPPYG